MLYLIGLGLNERGISKEGLLVLERCSKVYLESYTVNFPYNTGELKLSKKKIIKLKREEIESDKLIREAKSINVALLVYGSPLFATTHISLLLDADNAGVNTKVIYSASVFDAIAEIGLQLYKFGKTSSMPAWNSEKSYEPDCLQYVKENQSIKAHSLILVDIGLSFKKAMEQLEKAAKKESVSLGRIIGCSRLGTDNQRIFYGTIDNLKEKEMDAPFCFIVPSEMHFLEKEAIERFEI